ncbi:MAG: ABC transporter ATP-binding protein, partial [Candidatus Helarchaeota archaeon]
VKVKGRIGSLLEIGTGFHPELTGRENIYLNGAILGMKKDEVTRKFDEIVDFSGVEKFIDTPVKRYSSGMYVRLAFAVAAYLDPEILVVDEVLAVGDAEFQKKCLGKMGDVAGEGRTVLFVSHNMAAIQNLCGRTILLENGIIKIDDNTDRVVNKYLDQGRNENIFLPKAEHKSRDNYIRINNFWVNPSPAKTGNPVEFIFEIERPKFSNSPANIELAVGILSMNYERILHIYSRNMGRHFSIHTGKSIIKASINSLNLVTGNYRINLWIGSGNQTFDFIQDCYNLFVEPGYFREGYYIEPKGYSALLKSEWVCDKK